MARPPTRITTASLQRITERYLDRWANSRAGLRRLLLRKVRDAAAHWGDDPEAGAALVEAELDRLEGLGWLDDRRFAEHRARALHRRGAGSRKVRAALAGKGLDAEDVAAALVALAPEDGEDADFVAACTFARKRRLGPWRAAPVDAEGQRKELAKLGRAGFDFEVARRVLALERP